MATGELKYLSEEIIEEFEKNSVIPTSTSDWEHYSSEILLYLSAKKYLEQY